MHSYNKKDHYETVVPSYVEVCSTFGCVLPTADFLPHPVYVVPLDELPGCPGCPDPTSPYPPVLELFKYAAGEGSRLVEEMAFMVLAAFWVAGQGMHLSANSINNLAEALAKKQVVDITGTSIYQLAYFFDEHLSHYMWHIGVVGLAALLIYREWRQPAGIATTW